MGPGPAGGGLARSAAVAPATAATAVWEPLGPFGVVTSNFGLISGRITSIAFDPADATGNTVYVGTAGGGVWVSTNAATSNVEEIHFKPLTDRPAAMTTAPDASISIGAVSVQPGGTGVVLAGTGDPSNTVNSHYGAGVLRSSDGGNSWTLIKGTSDVISGLGAAEHGFQGEAFAGFAWSTLNSQVVVAAVSQSYESSLVLAGLRNYSSGGLYYSTDAGTTWHLSTITDGNGQDVQGPYDGFAGAEGNAATAVVWNPLRKLFIGAVRFHGYYQSSDGVTWTRLRFQPGSGLTAVACPTNTGLSGSPACPMFRGALAVNPLTGDTFAWTVDGNDQDQGLWQDTCNVNAGACTNPTIQFATKVKTAALETSTIQGAVSIVNGESNLVLAAVPSDKDTVLLAGANDLWKCSLAAGCDWRNTTNSTTCMSAHVGAYQHALAWNAANPLEIFAGNDSGLWRSEDGIAESGSACSSADADHWENLNGALGSLAEVESMSQVGSSSSTLMAGLGVNGTAGAKGDAGATAEWPQILDGYGGAVAIDPADPDKWYINNGSGVSIHLCTSASLCTPSAFGEIPVVSNADAGNDGLAMTRPAPFLVDPADPNQLLVATCRLWRGPPMANSWTSQNAVLPRLGSGSGTSSCSGHPLIRSLAAQPVSGGEVVYAGTFGSANGGAALGGHVLRAAMSSDGTWLGWTDLTLNPVMNETVPFNAYGLDVSSIVIDPHDTTGNTFYATIAGMPNRDHDISLVYRSTDGGAHWEDITSNLQYAPAHALAIDPVDGNTIYLASAAGVFATQKVQTCGNFGANCWFAYGSGIPQAPVTALSASPITASPNVLVAGTYGRGIWQIPLLTAGQQMTTAAVAPGSLSFADQGQGTTSDAQTISVTNTSTIALLLTSISVTGDFTETDNCVGRAVDTGASCSIHVAFVPTRLGIRNGSLTIQGNLSGGNVVVDLSGNGIAAPLVNLQPAAIAFGDLEIGTTSAAQQITIENASGVAVPISSITVSGPFAIAGNSCGSTSLRPNADCQITIEFKPTSTGLASGTFTIVDAAGTQTAQLSGTGTAAPTDTLSASSLSFPPTIIGVKSAAQTLTLANTGGNPLTSIAVSVSGPFQQTNRCTTQLAANASCSIEIVYLPTAAGTQTGSVTVADILQSQNVTVSGTGLLPPAFSVSPTDLRFANQPVNVTSAAATLTITNSGGASMSDVGFQISGTSAASFAIGTTTCGGELAPGSNCIVAVTFTPIASGTAQAALTITSSTSQVKPVTVPLSGDGKSAGGLSVTPSQLVFAPTALGQTSPAQTITVSNAAQADAAGLAITASGPFSLSQNGCGTTLTAGASCTTGVVFSPMQAGNLSGALNITSSSISPPATVALSGIGGLTGALQLQPAQVDFPTTGVGTSSSELTVTLTNISSSVMLNHLLLTASAGFHVSSTTCGSSLAGGATCVASLMFSPSTAGAMSGTLSITSTELAVAATVPLSGTGFDFAPAAAGSASQTVASGQTASYALTIAPSGGSASNFIFQCNSLPQYAACVFNPSNLSIAANTTGTETLQITTGQSSAALTHPAWRPAALPLCLGAGALLVPFAIGRRRRWLTAVLIAICLGAVTSCAGAGGGGGATPPSGTRNVAPGSYTVPVVITSKGVQHTVKVTLVVD